MVSLVSRVHPAQLDPLDPPDRKVSPEVKDRRVNKVPRVKLVRLEPLDRKDSRDQWESAVRSERPGLLAPLDELVSQVDRETPVTLDPLDQRDVLVHKVHSLVLLDFQVMHYNGCYELFVAWQLAAWCSGYWLDQRS